MSFVYSKGVKKLIVEEIWKDIEGYEGLYQISNLGNVKSLDREVLMPNGKIQHRKERIMSKRESTDGYYIAKFNVNKHSKCIAIHRLVAQTFIPNPNNLPEVNHLDTNRKNNCVDNLEWCTHAENVQYSYVLGHYKGKYGELNPNYNNHTLSEKYKNNPELAKEKCGRKGGQNGRAVSVVVKGDNFEMQFDYMRQAAEYLINNHMVHAKTADVVANHIARCIKENDTYCGLSFYKV